MDRRAAFRSTHPVRVGAAARRWLAFFALLFAVSTPAHRAPGSLTTVEWNEQTGRTEIVHRLHSHDAELGVGELLDQPGLSVLSLEGRATIALYVEERFAILGEGRRLPLDLVGAELVADFLLVYQEWPDRLPTAVKVRNDILRDAFPAQVNEVNLAHRGVVRTLKFSGDDTWRDFEFVETPPGSQLRQ